MKEDFDEDFDEDVEMIPLSSAIPWAIVTFLVGIFLGFMMAAQACGGKP